VTSSALTTRQHLSKALRLLLAIPHHPYKDPLLGTIQRLWDEVDLPNVLQCTVEQGRIDFTLHIYSSDAKILPLKLELQTEVLYNIT